MMNVADFTKRIRTPNSPFWLHIAMDIENESQLFIVVNGGMGNMLCAPIEQYLPEIKECALSMIESGELIKEPNARATYKGTHKVLFLKLREDIDN
ncbi:MAG: hypothetical protein ACI9VT_000908 [Psychroserpens sp.]|jgi:hypothetical protein